MTYEGRNTTQEYAENSGRSGTKAKGLLKKLTKIGFAFAVTGIIGMGSYGCVTGNEVKYDSTGPSGVGTAAPASAPPASAPPAGVSGGSVAAPGGK